MEQGNQHWESNTKFNNEEMNKIINQSSDDSQNRSSYDSSSDRSLNNSHNNSKKNLEEESKKLFCFLKKLILFSGWNCRTPNEHERNIKSCYIYQTIIYRITLCLSPPLPKPPPQNWRNFGHLHFHFF